MSVGSIWASAGRRLVARWGHRFPFRRGFGSRARVGNRLPGDGTPCEHGRSQLRFGGVVQASLQFFLRLTGAPGGFLCRLLRLFECLPCLLVTAPGGAGFLLLSPGDLLHGQCFSCRRAQLVFQPGHRMFRARLFHNPNRFFSRVRTTHRGLATSRGSRP